MSEESTLLSNIWDILSFKAFTPDITEASVALRDRAAQRTLGGLYIGSTQMSSCIIRHTRGGFVFSDIVHRPIDFPLRELRPEDFKSCFKEKVQDIVLTVGGMTEVSLRTNIRKQPEANELVMLSTQPQKMLGQSFAKNIRYSILHHPTQNQCFLAATDQLQLNTVFDVLDRAQFRVARAQSAMVSALDKILDEEEVKTGRAYPLILENGNAFYTKITPQGVWEGWRYRANVITSPADSVLKVFLNSLSLSPEESLLVVDMGSNYEYPIEQDLEGINFRKYDVPAVGSEFLPFYFSTLN